MSYYHEFFQRFDGCSVSVAFSNPTNWRHLSVVTTREFPSLMDAVDFTLDKQRDLQSIIMTAHPATGTVDLSQQELATLLALAQEIRDCQD